MMTLPEVRNQVVIDIEFAVSTGARQHVACAIMGIATTTLRRWKPSNDEAVQIDQRPHATRPAPANRLNDLERQRILSTCNEPDYCNAPPSQIVPRLADQGAASRVFTESSSQQDSYSIVAELSVNSLTFQRPIGRPNQMTFGCGTSPICPHALLDSTTICI
jgi:hypothetical protein